MSLFGTSRFTALLAAIALSGTAGMFWWALETRSEMKAASSRAVSRMLPVKAGGRVLADFQAGVMDPIRLTGVHLVGSNRTGGLRQTVHGH